MISTDQERTASDNSGLIAHRSAADLREGVSDRKTTSWRDRIVPLVVLCAMVFLTRWRALCCFFHADDLICIDNLHRIFHGQPQFLLERLVSPWQNPHIQLLYRPLADILFCIDYMAWGSNPVGYHLTNLLLHCATVFCVYAMSLQVFRQIDEQNSGSIQDRLPAFLIAGLFAVNPLSTEVVVWVVGRLDLSCSLFFLASVAVFVSAVNRHNQRSKLRASLALHILALLSKEVAVVLPAVLVASNVFLLRSGTIGGKHTVLAQPGSAHTADGNAGRSIPLAEAFVQAFKDTGTFWTASLLYLVLRTTVLGTFPGGYIGSHGEALAETLIARLLQVSNFERIVQPIPLWLFPSHSIEAITVHSLFTMCGLVIFSRIPFLPWNAKTFRLIGWGIVCAVITFAPSAQIYQLSSTLAFGRLLYLPGAFLALAVVAALVPLSRRSEGKGKIQEIFRVGAATVLTATILVYGVISFGMVKAWEEAGNLLINLRKEIAQCIDQLPPSKNLVLLNLPGEHFGAYVLFTPHEIKGLVGPEFNHKDYSNRIATTDIYPIRSPISCQRLIRLVTDPNYEVRWYRNGRLESFVWRPAGSKRPSQNLRVVRLDTGSEDEARYFVSIPSSYDAASGAMVKVSLTFNSSIPGSDWLRWCAPYQPEFESDSTKTWVSTIFGDGVQRDVYAPLLELGRPPVEDRPVQFVITVPNKRSNHVLHSVSVIPASSITKLAPVSSTLIERADGTCEFRPAEANASFSIDAGSVPNASKILVEISRPDVMFNFSHARNFRERKTDKPGRTAMIEGVSCQYTISRSAFPVKGRYQIRAAALDKDGNVVGLFSDPIAFLVGCAD